MKGGGKKKGGSLTFHFPRGSEQAGVSSSISICIKRKKKRTVLLLGAKSPKKTNCQVTDEPLCESF